jgi:hypothetical protein
MNKFAAFMAVAMFALGVMAGHSMNASAPAVAAMSTPASAFELMQNAIGLPETTADNAV